MNQRYDRRKAGAMGAQALRQPLEIRRDSRTIETYQPDGRGGAQLRRVLLSLPRVDWQHRPDPQARA